MLCWFICRCFHTSFALCWNSLYSYLKRYVAEHLSFNSGYNIRVWSLGDIWKRVAADVDVVMARDGNPQSDVWNATLGLRRWTLRWLSCLVVGSRTDLPTLFVWFDTVTAGPSSSLMWYWVSFRMLPYRELYTLFVTVFHKSLYTHRL